MTKLDSRNLTALTVSVIALIACDLSAADPDTETNTTGSGGPACVDEDRSSQCGEQTTEASCRALLADMPQIGACIWTRWVTATIDDEGVCTYGEIRESCDFEPCHEACFEWPACGTMEEMAFVLHDNQTGKDEVARAPRCYPPPLPVDPCTWDSNGEMQDGSGVCRCLCDPAFPG